MINRGGILAAVTCFVLGGSQELSAGGIHIRYPVDAPEKLAHANEVYAQGVLNMYERHPRWFEHTHPFYTEMFHNPEMMDRLVVRWEAHEQRFRILALLPLEGPGWIRDPPTGAASSLPDPTPALQP